MVMSLRAGTVLRSSQVLHAERKNEKERRQG
jgi:hypothetical protein